MKVGFLDSVYNYADVFEAAAEALQAKIANVSVERFTTPHLLKIPVCAKLLFEKGCDSVLVFLTAIPDDFDEIRLVQEKIVDLEVAEKKFVFFVIVSDAEFHDEEKLKELTKERVTRVADAIEKVVQAPAQLAANIADPGFASAMGMFSTNPETAPASSTEDERQGDNSDRNSGLDSGNSLF